MVRLIAITIFPIFSLIWLLAKDKEKLRDDAYNWCRWKKRTFTRMNIITLFVKDKAFRNLTYFRAGKIRIILSWLLPGYDSLQITTAPKNVEGGLIIQHGFSTIISAKKIGKNCKIYQQVTIGFNHKLETPIIKDNVEICCGAKIIGGVTIGNNVLIGANAVVVRDVPDNSIVAGIPAKIIGRLKANKDIFNREKE